MSRGGAVLARLRTRKLWRAWSRYGAADGPVLAAGIAYFAFFSVFPALAVGFTILGTLLDGRDARLRAARYVNSSVGVTVIGTLPGSGIVQLDTLVATHVLTVTGLVALGALLVTGLGWLGAVRSGIRAVFGSPGLHNPVQAKLRDLGMLVTLGVAVILSIAAGVVATSATDGVLGWLGLERTAAAGFAVTVLTQVALLLIDTALFLMYFRFLADVRLPIRDLLAGALLGAAGLALLKISGGLLLTRTPTNRFLAASSVVVGILVWMNLFGRLTLLAASWAAVTAADRGHLPVPAVAAGAGAAGEPVVEPVVEPSLGPSRQARERTVLAAGLVFGAVTMIGLRVARRGARELVSLVRSFTSP